MNDEERYARLAEKVNKEQVIEMNAMERLRNSMVRVRALVNFYREHPETTLDMMDSMTAVTMEDLKTLLDALADRDISLKRPEFKTPREIERDIKLAKEINKEVERKRFEINQLDEDIRRLERLILEKRLGRIINVWKEGEND